MTFAAPAWLVLLAAVPLLWWLHRRLRRPREVVVASIAPFRGDVEVSSSAAPSRPWDVELWLVLGAAALLALAAAAPELGGSDTPELRVVGDVSWSMRVRNGTSSTARELAAAVKALDASATLVAIDLLEPHSAGTGVARWYAPGSNATYFVPDSGMEPPRGPALRDGLPGSLVPHLTPDSGPIVLLTDRELDLGPDVLVVRPSDEPDGVVAIVGVVLEDDELVVSLRRDGDVPASGRRVSIYGRGRLLKRDVDFAGESAIVRLPITLPESASSVANAVRLTLSVSSGPAVFLQVCRPVRRIQLDGPTTRDVLGDVLVAVGAELVTSEPSAVVAYGVGPRHDRRIPSLIVAANLDLPAREVDVASLRGEGLLADFRPAADAVLFARGSLDGGHPVLLRDRHGPLVAHMGSDVATALDPAALGSTWTEDPSYPVFFAAALETLSGRTGIVTALGIVPPDEVRLPRGGDRTLDSAKLADILRRSRGTGTGIALATPLSVIAAALLLVLALRTGRPRFSMPRRGRVAAR